MTGKPKFSLFTLGIILFLFAGRASAVELLYPANTTVTGSTVVLQWNPDPIGNSYRLQISLDSSFVSPLVNIPTTATSYFFNMPFADTMYYWRVYDRISNDYSLTAFFQNVMPTAIPDLAAWYKADDGVTVSGGLVSAWLDKSGNNHNLSQPTTINQPSYLTSIPLLNNMPAVRFDAGANIQFMPLSSNLDVTAFNIFTFRNDEPNSAVIQYLLGGIGNGLIADGTNALNAGPGAFGGGGLNAATNHYFLYALFNNSNRKVLVNNVSVPLSYTDNATSLSISRLNGRPDVPDFVFKGNISEILAYARNLSDTENSKIYNYIRSRYAPPVNLGRDLSSTLGS